MTNTRSRLVADRRPLYQDDLAQGLEAFFEPRRDTCPWCASSRLRVRVRTADRIQRKPGRFVIDECLGCGHVFQNPRLTTHGLEFYYRDFYDGLGQQATERMFASGSQARVYRARARAVRALGTPVRWLDVGTGHGHFCATAKGILPDTEFHGLDWSDGVEVALREGRISRAYRGSLIGLVDQLAGQYDVVSMHHYLEHTLDPRLELASAREALRPGGLLLIEVPDPESVFARLLGRWWGQWVQPQHLHLMPLANLCGALDEGGFTVVATDRREPHIPVDLAAAALSVLNSVVPAGDVPWLSKPPTAVRRWVRACALVTGAPVVLGLFGLDHVLAPVARRTSLSNAYRVIARKH